MSTCYYHDSDRRPVDQPRGAHSSTGPNVGYVANVTIDLQPGRVRWLVIGSIVVRVAAALALALGPWADDPGELDGWDVARFQEIAHAPGRHWVDHEVEYPPGSVIMIEAVAAEGVVGTHRRIVALSLVVDLAVAAMVAVIGGPRAATAYLMLGLPLVPMGLLRFDLWAVALAVLALVALTQRRTAAFAVLTTAAAMVKVWPALLLAAAFAAGPIRARGRTPDSEGTTPLDPVLNPALNPVPNPVTATVGVMAVSGLAWLVYGGWSLDPVDQVLSLRGATGWHVESLGGTLTALFTDEEPRAQLNAFRIGELNSALVLAGRALTIAVVAALVLFGRRAASDDVSAADHSAEAGLVEVAALVMLGSTAALIVTAPLLSPQFLLWLTPWAALLASHRRRGNYLLLGLTAAATVMTGLVLTIYGPPRLAETAPALALLGRNLVLVAVAIATIVTMRRWALNRSESPLGHCGSGPGPAGADA